MTFAVFPLPEALESLKEINESVCPNEGFLDQVSFHYDLLHHITLKLSFVKLNLLYLAVKTV